MQEKKLNQIDEKTKLKQKSIKQAKEKKEPKDNKEG